VEAAKKEGKLVLMTHPGTDYQGLVRVFQERYPGIRVEHTGARPSDFSPKLITEQKNGQYLWDVMTASTSNKVNVLTPTGAFQDIRPFMIRSDVKDDSKWQGGFEWYAQDVSKQTLSLVSAADVVGGVFVNRDVIPKSEFSTVEDLLNPKWKGKIVIDDPSVPAHGSLALTGILKAKGEDFLRRFFAEQQPVVQDTVRITTEWIATGRYPLAVGVDTNTLDELQKNGVGKNVERHVGPLYVNTRGVSVFKNAPNPNAAKVWVNWFLSQEGQTAWVNSFTDSNSRRTDVPVKHPAFVADYNKLETYTSPNTERDGTLLRTVFAIYRETRR